GVAAIRYAQGRKDVDPERLVVFGQSLGGAIAISAVARAGLNGIRAVVVEGTFDSYQAVVRRILARGWLTWPFQYPVAWMFFSDSFSPRDDLPRLASVPLLVVHGEADRTVPIEAGRALYDAFSGQDREFWSVPAAGHMEIFGVPGSPWRDKLVAYLAQRMGKPQ
ncbi:MAG TPA: alpha/beta hydrolase, partial [bacterium]